MLYGPIAQVDYYYITHLHGPDMLKTLRECLRTASCPDPKLGGDIPILASTTEEALDVDSFLYMFLYKRNRPKEGLARIAFYDKLKKAIDNHNDSRFEVITVNISSQSSYIIALFYLNDLGKYIKASISLNRMPSGDNIEDVLVKHIRFWYTLLLWEPVRFYKVVKAFRLIEGIE